MSQEGADMDRLVVVVGVTGEGVGVADMDLLTGQFHLMPTACH